MPDLKQVYCEPAHEFIIALWPEERDKSTWCEGVGAPCFPNLRNKRVCEGNKCPVFQSRTVPATEC